MITVTDVKETHLWCQSCHAKEEPLVHVSIELGLLQSEGEIEIAAFRLCNNCAEELQTKITKKS